MMVKTTKTKTNTLSSKAKWLKTAKILMDQGNHCVTDVANWAS